MNRADIKSFVNQLFDVRADFYRAGKAGGREAAGIVAGSEMRTMPEEERELITDLWVIQMIMTFW
jgi:hypothetical protein